MTMSNSNPHLSRSNKGPFVVGKVTMDMDITVEPALAAHHMWEASCEHFDFCALGRTPGEAVVSLGKAIQERGMVKHLDVDAAKVDDIVKQLGGAA